MVRKLAVRFSPSLSISFTGFSTPEHHLAAAPPLTAVSSAPPALARATALDRLLEPRACSPTYPRSKPSSGRPIRPCPVMRRRTRLAAGALHRRQLRPKSSRPSDLRSTATIRSIPVNRGFLQKSPPCFLYSTSGPRALKSNLSLVQILSLSPLIF